MAASCRCTPLSLLLAGALLAGQSAASDGPLGCADGTCAVAGYSEESSLLQLRQESQMNESEGFDIITSSVVVGIVSAAAGALASKVVTEGAEDIWEKLTGPDAFNKTVGAFGLPLTVGVINNRKTKVMYEAFDLKKGKAWGQPPLKTGIPPGEMFQWFLYTRTVDIQATMLFQAGTESWSVGLEQHRLGNWGTGCDRLRTKVVHSGNMTKALEGLCKTLSGSGAGVQVKGGYGVQIYLNEA